MCDGFSSRLNILPMETDGTFGGWATIHSEYNIQLLYI